MRILHVNLHRTFGGVEQYIHRVSRLLAENGHTCALLHDRDDHPHADDEAFTPIQVVGCMRNGQSKRLAECILAAKDFAPDVILFHKVPNPRLWEWLSGDFPCAAFIHDVKAVCPERKMLMRGTSEGLPALCPFPVEYTCQARAYRHRCMPRNPLKGLPLLRDILRTLETLRGIPTACPSDFLRSLLLQNGIPQEHVSVIPHFVESSRVDPAPQRKAGHILYVGRLTGGKGVETLLAALEQLPADTHLTIAGDGPDRSVLENLAQRLNVSDRATFAGWQTQDALNTLYRTTSVVAVPSQCHEGFCMVGPEAMAAGTPVVASPLGGITQWLIDGNNGIAIPPGDDAALVEALGRILSSTELAKNFGRQGQLLTETHFSPARHLADLTDFLTKAAHGTPAQDGP